MGKRSQDDAQWQSLKKAIRLRDGHCRLVSILTAKEFLILQKNAGRQLSICDPAHVLSVGGHEKLCYDQDNVVLLNHYSHSMLDSCRNPLNGDMIKKEERDSWWIRIIGKPLYDILLEKMKMEVLDGTGT